MWQAQPAHQPSRPPRHHPAPLLQQVQMHWASRSMLERRPVAATWVATLVRALECWRSWTRAAGSAAEAVGLDRVATLRSAPMHCVQPVSVSRTDEP